MNTLKIGENLFRKDNYIISYKTKVAVIKGNDLIELGKFSRTTSKHVRQAADIFGLNLIKADPKRKPDFYMFGMCIKIDMPNSLSRKTSTEIIRIMTNEGVPYIQALASLDAIPKKDQAIVNQYLKSNGISDENFGKLKKWCGIRKMVN